MSELQLVQESIANLESARADLLRQLHDLDQKLVSEKAKHARLRNQHVPIHTLPNELLALVFADAHALLRSSRSTKADLAALRFLVETSQVCARWRHVVLHTPLLWNTVVMTVTTDFKSNIPAQEYLLAHLRRSGDAYLDMSFFAETGEAPDLDLFFAIIKEHATRWRRLSIDMRYADPRFVRGHLAGLHCPLLIHFSINIADSPNGRSPQSPRTQYPDIGPQVFENGAPRLETLRLANEAIGNLHPNSNTLQTLHLGGWDNGFFTWAQLKSLLESLPRLQNLSLHEICVRFNIRDPLKQTPPIHLPELRCLRLHKPFTPLDKILPLLTVPKLERVSLHDMDAFDCAEVPTVTHLIVDSCPFQEHHAEKLISSFPNLQHLSLDAAAYSLYDPGVLGTATSSPGNLTGSTSSSPEKYPWPHLHTLTMRDMPPTDVATFALMVLKRKVDNHPISTIRLDKRSRNVFRLKGKLELLQENTPNLCTLLDPPRAGMVWPPGRTYEDPHDLV